MIRHRPLGSGHPYSADTDQRWPPDPVEGEPLRLGVRASVHVTRVLLEWELEGTQQEPLALKQSSYMERGRVTDDGHLAGAQGRQLGTGVGWEVWLNGLRRGQWLRYRFASDDGNTRWFDTTVNGWVDGSRGLVTVGRSRIVEGTAVSFGDGYRIRRLRFAMPLEPDEHVGGFGERFDRLDQRGLSLDSVVFEQYKNQGATRNTYLPMPFGHVVGGTGWGFHVRTSRRVWFDVGETDPGLLWVEAETGPDGVLEIVYYDGTPREVLSSFLDEVGRPEEMPEWVFGLWASGNEWNTQAEVMRQADSHRENDIPLSNLVIEAWSDECTFTEWRGSCSTVRDGAIPKKLSDFIFPDDGPWPDPAGMVAALHERDVRVHLWQIPLLKMRPHPAEQAAADAAAAIRDNILIREPTAEGALRPYRNRGWWFPLALMPDLTDGRAAHWWTEKRRYLVEEIGIDGFKTDGGEHAWGRELVYLDGGRGDEKNNSYPVAYAKAYGELMRRTGKAPVTFSRAGFTGSQSHGAYWAGDENSTWQAFRWSLNAGLNAAASGILYWGWDMAGFSGEIPSAELYLRSAAAATFVPVMQYHSEFNFHRSPSRDRTPWNIQERTGDNRVIPTFRRFAQLRERLIPYLARSAHQMIARGEPLMRPLYFDYPDVPLVWSHPLQWTLGDSILVAPVTDEGADSSTVYLPSGGWRDAFTGEYQPGGQTITRRTPWHEVPVWVREHDWDSLESVFSDQWGSVDPE